MKFLVTGGTGFIGQCVSRSLLRRGIPTVVAETAFDHDAVPMLKREAEQAKTLVDFVPMDVSDFRDVVAVFHKHPDITHAIHLAYVMGALVDDNTSLSVRVNVLGMTHMFEMAVQKKLTRLVFTSSQTVAGPSQKPYGDRPVTEDDFCDPSSHLYTYAVMKILNEHMGRKYIEKHKASICCTRPPMVFGHGRKRTALPWLEDFASKPAVGKPVVMPVAPHMRDTWIYKDDCAEQLIRLALKPQIDHFVYNAGGHCVSAQQLMEIVKKWVPDTQVTFDPSKLNKPLIDHQDGTRLINEIGFKPRALELGVLAHINEARAEAGLPLIVGGGQ